MVEGGGVLPGYNFPMRSGAGARSDDHMSRATAPGASGLGCASFPLSCVVVFVAVVVGIQSREILVISP